ncbi:MAG: chromosomal replication initiator protein DnaA, partial [Desulfuromonadales bacterium]|nr:chromosomal replication initiator protein DnaA [Desulfuromonadales bacterium]
MDKKIEKTWAHALNELKSKISDQNISTWIMPIQPVNLSDNKFHVEVPNKFIKDWIKDNYKIIIEEVIYNILKEKYVLDIKTNSKIKTGIPISKNNNTTNNTTAIKNIKKKIIEYPQNMNIKYTFDSFVSGTSNQFAHAAAMAVSDNPATTYNPLFIYGGVGLGKTHLINAIGNQVYKKNSNTKICYYSSEKFTNELINSLRHGKMEEFRNKFRSIDILLIDDIQFIAGKKSTQEEFFHTFNALLEGGSQIILTCDRYPKEVDGLEERLKSRFGWGLPVCIDPPELETRVAILQKKAEEANIDLPSEVAFFIAKRIRSNIRELEGAFRRVLATANFTASPITLDFAKEALRDLIAIQERTITIDNIQKTVAEYYKIRTSDLHSNRRSRSITRPRQLAMALSKELTNHSLP